MATTRTKAPRAPHLLDPAAVTPAVALEALRLDYRRKVEILAEQLRAVKVSGLTEDQMSEAGTRFEEEVARPLVAPDDAAAWLTLSLSPSAGKAIGAMDGASLDPQPDASIAASMDAAALAGATWFLDGYNVSAQP